MTQNGIFLKIIHDYSLFCICGRSRGGHHHDNRLNPRCLLHGAPVRDGGRSAFHRPVVDLPHDKHSRNSNHVECTPQHHGARRVHLKLVGSGNRNHTDPRNCAQPHWHEPDQTNGRIGSRVRSRRPHRGLLPARPLGACRVPHRVVRHSLPAFLCGRFFLHEYALS